MQLTIIDIEYRLSSAILMVSHAMDVCNLSARRHPSPAEDTATVTDTGKGHIRPKAVERSPFCKSTGKVWITKPILSVAIGVIVDAIIVIGVGVIKNGFSYRHGLILIRILVTKSVIDPFDGVI